MQSTKTCALKYTQARKRTRFSLRPLTTPRNTYKSLVTHETTTEDNYKLLLGKILKESACERVAKFNTYFISTLIIGKF